MLKIGCTFGCNVMVKNNSNSNSRTEDLSQTVGKELYLHSFNVASELYIPMESVCHTET